MSHWDEAVAPSGSSAAAWMAVAIWLSPTARTPFGLAVVIDCARLAASLTHTKEREAQIAFSLTTFVTGQKVMVKKSSGVETLAQLAGRKVLTVKGQVYGRIARLSERLEVAESRVPGAANEPPPHY